MCKGMCACSIRWSAMALCFSLRVIFCYIYILGTSKWRSSVCVCVGGGLTKRKRGPVKIDATGRGKKLRSETL